jgi:hypothetical protein
LQQRAAFAHFLLGHVLPRPDRSERGNDLLGITEHRRGKAAHAGNKFLVVNCVPGTANPAKFPVEGSARDAVANEYSAVCPNLETVLP